MRALSPIGRTACGDSAVPETTRGSRRSYNAARRIDRMGGAMADTTTELEAAAFRRLRDHLARDRPDVQNIDLMILAGFCRNCLADWYREAAAERGIDLDREAAREAVYGEPFADWKAKHQREATPEQLATFERARRTHPATP